MAQHGKGQLLDIVGGNKGPAPAGGQGFGALEQGLGGPGAGPQPEGGVAPGGAGEGYDVVRHVGGDGHRPHLPLQRREFLRRGHRFHRLEGDGVPHVREHPGLLLRRGVAQAQPDHEPVQLGGGEAEGTLGLHRVLGSQHGEGGGEGAALPVQGDLPLLHGLQQGGLGAGNGAVELVGQQQVGEHRPVHPAEGAALAVEDVHAHHVGGEQVRGELDPPELAAQGQGQGLDQGGLAHPRQVVQQDMPLGQDGRRHQADLGLLAHHDFRDLAHQGVGQALNGRGHGIDLRKPKWTVETDYTVTLCCAE